MSEDYGQLKKGSKEYKEKRQEIKSEVLKKNQKKMIHHILMSLLNLKIRVLVYITKMKPMMSLQRKKVFYNY